MFREKIGCVVLRVHSTHGSAECDLFQEDRSISNFVACGFLVDFHCVFLHRLPYCDHLRLSSCSARWYASSSTLSARCPATGMNESVEEDDPYASPARKLSASNSSFGRRHSIEVCPTRMMDHPYSFCRTVPRGDPQEVMNLGLAALDSPLVFNEKSVFSASRIAVAFAAFAYSSGSEITFWRFTCGPSMFAFQLDMI